MSKAAKLGIWGWVLGTRENSQSPTPSPQSLVPSPIPNWETLGCELAAEVLRSSGRLRLRANGASMLPAVWPGDILSVRRHDAAEVLPGDIVLFAREGRLVAHRVVEVRRQGLGAGDWGLGAGLGTRGWGLGTGIGHWVLGTGFWGIFPSPQHPIPSPQRQHPVPSTQYFVTRGDSVEGNDAPISGHELLGRVTAIERGARRLTPHRSVASRLASWILCRSDLCTRLVLRLRIQDLGFRI